ncbi:hypothetical protein PZE06_16295 [Robertmurraya sp. DFI.2.37]|jgi:hypothetical protein|nr:hypothetical protein [Robertmurraya sp. DFI.2.37]MDF1509701.1 hypothetical protein [Robertmurraya sp. DFI.2.37]
MNITEKVFWAELKLKVLYAAMMINDGYTNEDVINQLMEILDLLENTKP